MLRIIDTETCGYGKQLVPPRGYDLNIDNFVGFLKSGVEAYNAQK